MVRIRSRASRSFTRIPALAEVAVEIEMTNGIARPRAWGQAMTSTVTVRITPCAPSPRASHTAIVTIADPAAR